MKGSVVRIGRRFYSTGMNGVGGETKRETGMCKMRVTNSKAYEDGFFMASGKFGSKKTRVAGIALSIVWESGDS